MKTMAKSAILLCLCLWMVLGMLVVPTYAAQTEGVMVLTADTKIDMALTGDLYVDLNGYSLGGIIKTNGYRVYGMDSSTDEYDDANAGTFHCTDEKGAAVVPQQQYQAANQNRYMAVQETDGYSFHRFYLGITHVRLVPSVTGFGYRAAFRSDPILQSQIAKVGYELWLTQNNVVSRSTDFKETLTLRLENFDPESYGETPVHACATMTFQDGTVVRSSTYSSTLRQTVETVNGNLLPYSRKQINAVWDMISRHEIMQTWDVRYLMPGKLYEDTVYRLRLVQGNLGNTYYLTGNFSGNYWEGNTDLDAAAMVHVETVGSGYRFYFENAGGVKTYLQAAKSGSYVRPQNATSPTQTWYYHTDADVYTVTINSTKYYMSAYNNYSTIGVSNIYYITGNNAANKDVSQFYVEFIPVVPVSPDIPDTPDTPEDPCDAHADADNNGLCDRCKADVRVIIDLYAINDLHGKLTDGDNHPGVDELSTYISNARAANDNVILLSSGDMWQGAAESNLTRGNIITEWMNEMDFVSMTIGNHEYDWGSDAIAQNAEIAEFPFLAINIYDYDTRQRVDYCESSVVVDVDGVQVGIIGAVGDCYSSISVDRCSDVYFLTGSTLSNLIKKEAESLRSQGVDFIVLSIHDGGESSSDLGNYDLGLSNGYVDLVFEAHTHQSYVQKDSNGVYHLQGGGDNKGITYASVSYNTVNANYTVDTAKTISSSTYSSLSVHSVVQELLDKYNEQIKVAYEVLGNNRTKRTSAVLKQLVADLYAKAGIAKWGGQYNIVLGGGFLNTRSPYDLAAGSVTYGDLMDLLPFDNRIVLCKVKGNDLLSKFINTSNTSYYIGYTDYGNAIKNSISSSGEYYIVVDTYTAYYAYNNLTIVEFYEDNVYARDLVAQYIKSGYYS